MLRVPDEEPMARADLPTAEDETAAPPVDLNQPPPPRHTESDMMVHEVVCHRDLPMSEAFAELTYEGRGYAFCSPECRDAFLRDPEAALRREAAKIRR